MALASRNPGTLIILVQTCMVTLIFCYAECTTVTCLGYGHSCWGAHGKRSDIQGMPTMRILAAKTMLNGSPQDNIALSSKIQWILSRLITREPILPMMDKYHIKKSNFPKDKLYISSKWNHNMTPMIDESVESIRLDDNNEVKYSLEVEEIEECTMTCLGVLVFADKHSRQSLTSNDSSKKQVDSLSLAYEDLFTMPYNVIQDYSFIIQHLDISNNMFSRNLQFLLEFDNLKSVNLDHNKVDDFTVFPNMPNLELLWLNHNRIKNLYPFIKNLHRSVPNLKYLCLMGNEAAPSYLNGGDFYDYLRYRLYVLSWFPHLVHLDDRTVTKQQLFQAKKLFKRSLLEDFVMPQYIKVLHNKIAVYSKSPVFDRQRVLSETNLIV